MKKIENIRLRGHIDVGESSGEHFIPVIPMDGSQDTNRFWLNVKSIKKFRLRTEEAPNHIAFWDERDQIVGQSEATFADDDDMLMFVVDHGINVTF